MAKVLLGLADVQILSLDIRYVSPLAVVGLNYRHRALRQECSKIFTLMFRREGVWDASMMGQILSWMAEIEEGDLRDDEEYMPEDGIATIVHLNADEALRTVFITCSVGIRGCLGQTVVKDTKLVW